MNSNATPQLVTATAVLLACYAAVILFFVVRGALKIKSMSDYAVGSVRFSPVAVGLSLAASMTSAATFIINPGFVAINGLSAMLSFGVVMPLASMVSLVVFTKGFRKHGQTVKAHTLAQWIGSRFQSAGLTRYFGWLSLLLITFIVLICVGLTQVLSNALNAPPLPVLVGVVVFIFGYMMFGGANSMVYTNTIQASLKLLVAIVLLTSGYEHFSQGVHGFIAKLAAIDPALTHATNPGSYLFRDYFEIIVCQIVIGVAIVCQPHLITKSLLLDSEKDVNRYLLTAVAVLTVFFSVVFVGLYARLSFPGLLLNGQELRMDKIMSAYVVREFPVYLGLLVILGLISAGISTLESLIQSLSSTITADIIRPLLPATAFAGTGGFGREILLNRVVIAALGGVAIWLSYDQFVNAKLSVAIFAQTGVYAYFAAAFVPVSFGIFLRDAPRSAVTVASVTALLVHFAVYFGRLTPYMQAPVRNPGVSAALGIMASVAVGGAWYLARRRARGAEDSEAAEVAAGTPQTLMKPTTERHAELAEASLPQ
ncbi:sodium:solute symporter family transporter [Hymenobacter rubripertinctus]|uniref:Sodium:solute symporter n=1 Tax=Hymenobacter rubripertinctus TaxID=2029981 RepID=A0A418QVC8_9BACT|nr:sodium:solute symporter [Hymenobacter rubripertinctus]RIY09061.1 sodium:solute symporter [Hymenobacter rubripertinctus]